MYSREAMNKARAEVQRASNTGFYQALQDILTMELETARESLEFLKDPQDIYRAQGRVTALRDLRKHITPE